MIILMPQMNNIFISKSNNHYESRCSYAYYSFKDHCFDHFVRSAFSYSYNHHSSLITSYFNSLNRQMVYFQTHINWANLVNI